MNALSPNYTRELHSGLLFGLGARSLDDMSSMVLTSYWRRLNGKPIKLEEQGACHRRWGEEQDRRIAEAKARGEDSYVVPTWHCP